MMGSNGSITTHETNPVLFPFRSRKSRNNPANPKRVPKFEARLFYAYFCIAKRSKASRVEVSFSLRLVM
jgi:hypothetical protein